MRGLYVEFQKSRHCRGSSASRSAGDGMKAGDLAGGARGEIDAFNKKFVELHLKMDTPGIMAMWAEDGVDLMPGEAPLVGRKTITAWVENVLAKMPGYKVTKEEMVFHGIQCAETGRPSIKRRRLRKGNRISTHTRRWRSCSIARQAAGGRSSRKCGR